MVINVTTVTYVFRHRVYLSASPFNPYHPHPPPDREVWSIPNTVLFSGRTRAVELGLRAEFIYRSKRTSPTIAPISAKRSAGKFQRRGRTACCESIVIETSRIGKRQESVEWNVSALLLNFHLLAVNAISSIAKKRQFFFVFFFLFCS